MVFPCPCWPARSHKIHADKAISGIASLPRVAYFLAMTAAQPARESMPPVASAHDKILIVDFGSQVTHLIARRGSRGGAHSAVVPFQEGAAAVNPVEPKPGGLS